MKKVLILYASYGTGHKAIANYIGNYIKDNNNNVEIMLVDILDYSWKIIGSASQKINTYFMLNTPKIHNMFYKLADNKPISVIFDELATTMFKNKEMKELIRNFNPDLSIGTHFFGSSLIAHYNKLGIINSKLITVVTDYEAIEIWFKNHKYTDYFVVPNNYARDYLIKDGVEESKIKVLGIPVCPKIDIEYNKEKSMSTYNINPKYPTCLLFGGGGNGSTSSLKYIKPIILSNYKLNIIFVAGKNETSKNKVLELIKENNITNVKVLGFTNKVPELIDMADFVVTKPGGVQTTESLYFRKPLLMFKAGGAQEEANYKYFESLDYGKYFNTPKELNEFIGKIVNDISIIDKWKKNMKKDKGKEAMGKLYKLISSVLNI